MSKSNPFRFQRFSVIQEKASQKIGTDSVLLGAWCPLSEGKIEVLDIGTGTGVLSLMLAQRFPQAEIHAIEIEPLAAEEARQNFKNSPFAQRLHLDHCGLQRYDPIHRFDEIITNPPYFENSLLSEKPEKSLARHTTSLPLKDLVFHAKRLLKPTGKISLILPLLTAERFFAIARNQGFYLYQRGEVLSSVSAKKPIRILLQMGLVYQPCRVFSLPIRDTGQEYSESYRRLLKDFLTIFRP